MTSPYIAVNLKSIKNPMNSNKIKESIYETKEFVYTTEEFIYTTKESSIRKQLMYEGVMSYTSTSTHGWRSHGNESWE